MIYKRARFGNVDNVTVCEFGTGDIEMVQANYDNGAVCLCLKTQKQGEIGRVEEHGYKNTDDMQPQVVLMFARVESVAAVIISLEEIRQKMLSNK